MQTKKYTIDETFTHERIIEKSRFITQLFPTDTPEEAREAIALTQKKYHDASHNCFAYIVQQNTLIQKSSDDGEPSGTAGMPILQALLQRDMINITALVTRYFGGIKLGAGGLIRAYSHAILETLDTVPLMRYEIFVRSRLILTYEELKSIYFLQEKTAMFTIADIAYATTITVSLLVPEHQLAYLAKQLQTQLLREIKLETQEKIVKKIPL